jgi:ATP-dependent Clp protease ATP-binding subunit ClpA
MSNPGEDQRAPSAAAGDVEAARDDVMHVLRRHFRPEFLNRIDEIILFKGLDRRQLRSIVDLMLCRAHAG